MKRIVYIFISLFFVLSSEGQTKHLKPEFRNLSWVMDSKANEVISTLSSHYGNQAMIKTDSVFVMQDKYELYCDSLMLYKLTKGAYKEKSSKAKSTIIGGFEDSGERHPTSEWIRIFDRETRDSYANNNNSTIGDYSCYPSTYENLKLFYAKEKNAIKSYNNGRVKVYTDKSQGRYDTINFYIALHKTIKPIDVASVFYYSGWIPYVYIYSKPKQVVYPATIEKVWETKTGLPYSVAQELQLAPERVTALLLLPRIVNDEVLIKESLAIKEVYNIPVHCDTCNVILFDNHKEDNDVIDFTYKNESHKVTIKNAGTTYPIVLADENSFYIFALSEGSLETCTVDALIDGKNHIFELKKGERILIKLKKI